MEDNAARRYLLRVRRALVCSAASRRALSARAEALMEAFFQENPKARYRDLVSAFGPPGDFAETMLSELDEEEVRVTRRRKAILCRCLLAGLVLVLVLSSVFWYGKWFKAQEVIRGDFFVVEEPPQRLTEEEFNEILQRTPPEAQSH